jgi:hypothetical protein
MTNTTKGLQLGLIAVGEFLSFLGCSQAYLEHHLCTFTRSISELGAYSKHHFASGVQVQWLWNGRVPKWSATAVMAPLMKNSEMNEKETRAMKDNRAGGKSGSNVLKKSKRLWHKEILKAAFKTDFTKPDKAQEWGSQYKEKMAKKPGNQVLHVLAKKNNWPDDMLWETNQIKEFLDWTLERHHGLLEVKNDDQYTPLHLAIMSKNNAFVEAVLQNTKLINLGTVLSETCQYGNSLHVAIKSRLLSTELLIDKCARFSQMFAKGHPDSGNTPLHSCMSMDLNEEDGEENDTEYEESDTGDDDDTQSHSYQGGDGVGDDDLQDAKNLGRVVTNGNAMGKSLPPRRKSFMIPPVQESTMQSVKVVKLLIQKHDSVLSLHNKEKRTPYQERVFRLLEKVESQLATENSKIAREEAARKIIASDPIASYIRSYCVKGKDFSRDRIMEALYHPGQGIYSPYLML